MRKLIFVIMMLASTTYGQMVQHGKVLEIVRLCFGKHQVGDVVRNITARKSGYEVVNLHVTRSWTLTSVDTLRIVMAPKNKVKEARRQYYEMSGFIPDGFLIDGMSLYEVES